LRQKIYMAILCAIQTIVRNNNSGASYRSNACETSRIPSWRIP
jgi:hypothetical protein